MNKQPEKKTTVFTKKICKFKTSYYLCNTKFQRWIHLRVRIRASHARHRGSNPLSTTKSDCNSRSFYYCLSRVTGQGKFGQTEQRGPDELRSRRRVVTFEDKRSQSAIQSDRQRDLFLFCTPRLRHKSRNPIRAGCATEQFENRLSRRKTTAPDKGKNDPSRPPPALPVENSSEPKTARNPNSENHKFKITGGEPLVRRGCADLIRMIRQIPGTEEVTMTTNGVLLGENLEDLLAAGLDAVNISLDTLIPEKYQEITGADELERVRKSIFMAEKSEIRVKINTVLQKGVNDEEWKSLAELAKKNKLDVRFIELMPIGQGRAENGISGAWVLGKLKEAYGIEGEFYPLEGRFGNGPAVYYQLPGFQGKIGLISALHGKFCDRCNRIRMTSTGKLKACLCYADTISVFEAARHGSEEEIRKCLEQAIRGKPKMHHFEEQNFITEQKNMSQIGG